MPSSVIASYYYLKEKSALVITFLSGTVYEYMNVPENVYTKMKQTKSKGIYFNTTIKGKYTFKRIK